MSAIPWTAVQSALVTWVAQASGLDAARVYWADQKAKPPTGTPRVALKIFSDRERGLPWLDTKENPLTIAAQKLDAVDVDDNLVGRTNHALETGDGPVRFTTTGTLPLGLALATDYWLIRHDDDLLGVAVSRAAALAGTKIDIGDVGIGDHTMASTADTRRVGEELMQTARSSREEHLTITAYAADATGNEAAVPLLVEVLAALPLYEDGLDAAGIGVGVIGPAQGIGSQVVNSSIFEPRAIVDVMLFLAAAVERPVTNIETVEAEISIDDRAPFTVPS